MTFQQSDLNEDVEGEGKGFGNDQGVSLKCPPPSSTLRTPSPSREKVLLGFFGTVDSTTPSKPILPENTLSKGVWRDPPQSPVSLYERNNSSNQRALSFWERGERLRWVRVMIASS